MDNDDFLFNTDDDDNNLNIHDALNSANTDNTDNNLTPQEKALHQQKNSVVQDDLLNALITERTMNPEEGEEILARRLLREQVAGAVLNVNHIARHGTNERIRYEANKYIIERVLGKVGDDAFGASSSPVDDFISDVTRYVANADNS